MKAFKNKIIVDWDNIEDNHLEAHNEVISLYDYNTDTILFI
jgi:hypothetical protein